MKSAPGFTLVEVMVAMVLMALLIVGMAAAPLAARQLRVRAEIRAAAVNYGERLLERYRSLDFDSIDAADETVVTDLISGQDLAVTYRYRVTVQGYALSPEALEENGPLVDKLVAEDTAPQLKQVTAIITWSGEGYQSGDGQVRLSALIGGG